MNGCFRHIPGARLWAVAAALAACLSAAWGQGAPHLGYVYPAGGRQGTTVKVTVGGQFLRNPQHVYISGTGVTGSVERYIRPLNEQELGRTWWFLRDLVKRRWNVRAMAAARTRTSGQPPLPDHPWLWDLNEKSPQEMARLRTALFDPKRQPNAQLAEQVELTIVLDPEAAAGDRELRLMTAGGLSNPLCFQVGRLAEVREEEVAAPGQVGEVSVGLPVVLNGQIRPGETDRYRLWARAGQQLVVRVQARRLIPYLADAVPGWFQAVVALRDPEGREVVYADDYRFDPDPALCYQVAREGHYTLEIRDAIYRGREDFVYRVTVGEVPLVTSIFPLGGRAGTATRVALTGWNLPVHEATLDTAPEGERQRPIVGNWEPRSYGTLSYVVDAWPETTEVEPNDAENAAQRVSPPLVINGRIGKPGDVDVYEFTGQTGEDLVAEVWARRLASPLDAALRLVTAGGDLVGANDDHDDPEMALLTHQADPYLRIKLPADGVYRLYLYDTQRQGGGDFGYRLYLRPPRPDFALRVTPSSLSMPARRPATATIRALRRDGFDGEIEIALQEAPPGFTLNTARIPAGKDSVAVTLTPPRDAAPQIARVRLEGRAEIGGVRVIRPVTPAEEKMQAFAYWHLVPQQELLLAVTGARPIPVIWRPLAPGFLFAGDSPVRIPLGSTAQVTVTAPATLPDRLRSPLTAVRFALAAAPPGVRLQEARVVATGVVLTFKADAYCARSQEKGHLIVEATIPNPRQEPGAGPLSSSRLSLGVLPALPCELLPPSP